MEILVSVKDLMQKQEGTRGCFVRHTVKKVHLVVVHLLLVVLEENVFQIIDIHKRIKKYVVSYSSHLLFLILFPNYSVILSIIYNVSSLTI